MYVCNGSSATSASFFSIFLCHIKAIENLKYGKIIEKKIIFAQVVLNLFLGLIPGTGTITSTHNKPIYVDTR